jgi:retron-type reverse transcriptase
MKYPRPIRILSKSNLSAAWHASRDSGPKAGAPGTDGVRAKSYAANLDSKLDILNKKIQQKVYHFSKLRPISIPKEGLKKDRVICIPTVEDRLVQRTIAKYLSDTKMLPIYNSVSHGFIPELGTKSALKEVIDLRRKHDFVFETDISSFFDTIDRKLLRYKIEKALSGSSLVPYLVKLIQTEIKPSGVCDTVKLQSLGIVQGKGLRQGMPLSPTLANLALADFDKEIIRRKIKMVRYADDIVIFSDSKNAALDAGELVRELLLKLGHEIPEFGKDSKTRFVAKFDPLQFLGREIVFSEKEGDFIERVSKEKNGKMKASISEVGTLNQLVEKGETIVSLSARLTQRAASYTFSYSDAHNAAYLESQMRQAVSHTLKNMFSQVFGAEAVKKMKSDRAKFLGVSIAMDEVDEIDYDW